MPSYKLFYFNGRGRAEIIRLIFAAAGQTFEDVRIEFADWPNRKKEFKFGQLPVIEIDGERLNQSVAIMHYLSTQFGLAGKTPFDAAKCHAAVETMHDWVAPLFEKVMLEKDNAKREKLVKNEVEPEFKKHLTQLEGIVKEKYEKEKTHFLVAGQLTYADLAFHNLTFTITSWLGADYLKQFPHLMKAFENISSQPKIKEYLAKRPKTDF